MAKWWKDVTGKFSCLVIQNHCYSRCVSGKVLRNLPTPAMISTNLEPSLLIKLISKGKPNSISHWWTIFLLSCIFFSSKFFKGKKSWLLKNRWERDLYFAVRTFLRLCDDVESQGRSKYYPKILLTSFSSKVSRLLGTKYNIIFTCSYYIEIFRNCIWKLIFPHTIITHLHLQYLGKSIF